MHAFYIKYLISEITRRLGKTITVTIGLAMASMIIILIISFSQSLSSSQDKVLNPLQNVGTDALVTRSVNGDNLQALDATTRQEYQAENRFSINLAQLGKPGDTFSSDQFAPGTLLTFDATTTSKLDKNLVGNYATGLILNVTHQEGTVPNVTATFQTGGERIQVNSDIAPMTDAERAAIDAARQKATQDLQSQGIDPTSQAGRAAIRAATQAATPDRFKRSTSEVVTPNRTFTQNVGPINTDIKTSNFTIAGVDTSKTNIGLILPSQIVSGSYFNGASQVVLNKTYADKNTKKVGDTVVLSKVNYKVIGIVDPKLYTNTADVYMPLADLQKLSGKDGRVNMILVKATSASNTKAASDSLKKLFDGAQVVSSQDTAQKVSGSLVQAANLTNKFIGITSLILVVASFAIVSLLTIFSINKRTREIGTLKAIGWTNFEVVRQIVAENFVTGILGACLGLGLGVLAIYIFNKYNISFNATVQSMNPSSILSGRGGGRGFGFSVGGPAASTADSSVQTSVPLKIATSLTILILGMAVAIVGSLVSGFFAAVKVSRLRPQVALRNLE